MRRYVVTRLSLVVPVLVGVSIIIFTLLRLMPGDAIDAMLGAEGTLAPEVRTQLRQTLGLDAPLPIQYALWVGGAVRGDFGVSLRTGRPVSTSLGDGLIVTIELAVFAIALAALLGISLGVLTATRRNSHWDFGARLFGLIGLSLPNFWLATLLILLASRYVGWTPALEFANPLNAPLRNLQQILLPTVSLALALVAITMRMTRSAMLEVLGHDYIRVARAKGLDERTVLTRHALKGALIPVVTVMGVQMGYLLGGVVVIEQIFGLPGVGWTLLNALYERDYPVVQAGVLLLTLTFVLVNLAVDLLYGYLDPRIRFA